MGREFATSSFTTRFHLFGLDAMIQCGKDPVMDPAITPSEEPEQGIEPVRVRPHASAWLWRPWYAKLWWACIAIYWSGKLASYWSPTLDDAYSTALAGYLNIALYPFTAVMALGVRFAPAWMEYHGWEWVEPSRERMFPKRSVGGYLDPMADPLDPRSPRHSRRHQKL
ncbi:hypothetical protein GCM10009087_19580 [Sphingomonas oligophenolica]|uniref:Uncharacterized protein n=1 Tax=Sphingomonas oligophenolica TaxID=301154 RepID=A0ABU9Y305_9SPHN